MVSDIPVLLWGKLRKAMEEKDQWTRRKTCEKWNWWWELLTNINFSNTRVSIFCFFFSEVHLFAIPPGPKVCSPKIW